MSIRKRNEFLDADESDDGLDDGYNLEEIEESRGTIAKHANKRRKVDADSDASISSLKEDDLEASDAEEFQTSTAEGYDNAGAIHEEPGRAHISRSDHDRSKRPSSKEKSVALKQVEAAAKAVQKSGVIYISRVPPFMKPQTLKHFLEPHAPKGLGRVFLTPEEHASYLKRVKNGGNKKKSFSDGWVEFVSKHEAKAAAETLNGNIIGGKKGNFYHDDLWNIKYLTGFKWNHLTEQIANENAERAARLREEIRRTRRENKAFADDIERSKMLEGMESKRAAKQKRSGGKEKVAVGRMTGSEREFQQRKPMRQDEQLKAAKGSDDTGRILSKIL